MYTVRKNRKVRKREGVAMTEPKPFYTTGQAAKLLALSVDTIVRLWERGELEGYKTKPGYGGHLRVYRDSVERFDQARKEPAQRTG